MTEFYTIEEISKKTGVSQKTIRRNIASKKLLAEKIQNKYRIYKVDYEKWLKDKDNDIDNLSLIEDMNIQNEDNVKWTNITEEWKYCGWANNSYRNKYNFVDLFSGAGGLSCGLVMAGFTPAASVEIMPEAVKTYNYNFIENKGFKHTVESRDIRLEETKKNLYNSISGKHIHLIVGGFPCQGFSLSGNRVVTDERNSLYKDMLEIVSYLKPEYIVMENVEGLRSMLGGRIEKKIIDDCRRIGYDVSIAVLNSANYEVAQIRKRVIFIGNRTGGDNLYPKPIKSINEYKTLGEELERFLKIKEDKSINHIFTNHNSDMVERLMKVPEGGSLYGNYSDAWKKSPWNKPSCTIKENHGGVNIHPKLPRVLTPRELAAIQSFPDDFIFKGSKKWQLVQIGNAVPPLLGKAIGLAVLKALKKSKE